MLAARIDSLATRIEQLDTESSASQEELEQLVAAQQSVVGTTSALAERVEAVAGKSTELERMLTAVNDHTRELETRDHSLGAIGEETVQIRDRLEALQRRTKSDHGEIESMGEQLGALDEQSASLSERFEELGRRMSGLADHGQVLDCRTDDNRERINHLGSELEAAREDLERLRERVGAVEGTVDQDTALEVMDEKLTRLEAVLAEYEQVLRQARAATEDALAKVDRRLEEQQAHVIILGDKIEGVSADLERTAGTVNEEQQARAATEDALAKVDRRLEEQQAHVVTLNGQIEGISADLERHAGTVNEEQQARTAAEDALAKVDRRLEEQQAHVVTLNGQIEGISADLERHAGTLKDEQKAQGQQIASLIQAVDARYEELKRLATRLDDLSESDHRQAAQIDGIRDSIVQQSERQGKLEAGAKSTEDAVGDAKTLLHKAGEMLLETREDLRAHQVEIDNSRSGLRVLVWSGVVATMLLAALSIAGYLLQDSKQQMLRASFEKSAGRVESRIGVSPKWDIERTEDLEQDVRDLRTAVRDLQHSAAVNIPPQAPSQVPMADQNQGKEAFLQPQTAKSKTDSISLTPKPVAKSVTAPEANPAEALGGADQRDYIDVSDPLPGDETPPEPQAGISNVAPEPLISQPEQQPEPTPDASTAEAMWHTAQRERHYTIQHIGVHKLPSLARYATTHGLAKQAAVLETTRNGKPWFVLFNGSFTTLASAKKALNRLPPSLLSEKPWMRRLPVSGRIVPLD